MNVARIHIIGWFTFSLLLLAHFLSLTACSGSGRNNPASAPAENELVSLSITSVALNQTFQSNLYNYTVTAGYLQDSIRVIAIPYNTSATVTVDGVVLGADYTSQNIALVEGANPVINVVVSVAGFTDQTYTLNITRQNATNFAQRAYLKASNAGDLDKFGISVALDGDSLVVGAAEESGDANSIAASPNDNAFQSSAAYVFLRTDTSWDQ